MRIVRWAPQERVDQPDLEAMSFLVLGEFRRMIRELMLAEDKAYVLRGFKVEAENPASSRVVVKMDPGSGRLGMLLLGEDKGGGHIDWGQLTGGRDHNNQLEGAAEQILDFTGKAAATYVVEVRFTYQVGVADNRAFWDKAANSEYIQSTKTRHLPIWTAQISPSASGGDWMTLAEVAWDGAEVNSGEITDKREFPFEGTDPFQQDTQGGTGGIEDFDRSSSRADVGVNELYPVLRALARQVQDMKGQDVNGKFNWWNRAVGPVDPDNQLPSQQTKSLRSLDVGYITVGDGTTEWGDYNGTKGLENALQDIHNDIVISTGAGYPDKIVIVLKARENNDFTWDVSSPSTLNLTSKHVVIRAENAHSASGGYAHVDMSHTSGVGIDMGLGGALELENIWLVSDESDGVKCGVDGKFTAKNCILTGVTSDATTWLIDAPSRNLQLEDCTIIGNSRFAYDSDQDDHQNEGMILRCRFTSTNIMLREGGPTSVNTVCAGLRFVGCRFEAKSSPSAPMIDGRGAAWVTFDDCHLRSHGDEHAVQFGVAENIVPTYYPSRHWEFRNCRFEWSTAGTGGANLLQINGDEAQEDSIVANVSISNCEFTGTPSNGGTGIYMFDGCRNVSIENCRFENITVPSGDAVTAIHYTESAANHRTGSVQIVGCRIGSWKGAGDDITGIYIVANECTVRNCKLSGADDTDSPQAATVGGAIVMSGDFNRIEGCVFRKWDDASKELTLRLGSSKRCVITNNDFFQCSGHNIHAVAGATLEYCRITNNHFEASVASISRAINMAGATADHMVYMGNHGDGGIHIGTDDTATIIGNHFPSHDCSATTDVPSNARGFNETGQDLNVFSSYTTP